MRLFEEIPAKMKKFFKNIKKQLTFPFWGDIIIKRAEVAVKAYRRCMYSCGVAGIGRQA